MNPVLQAAGHFLFKGTVIEAKPFGNGHINRTFLVTTSSENYVLQALNTSVFKDPEAIFFNSDLLHTHLEEHHPDSELLIPLIPTKHGKNYLMNETGAWRAFPFYQHVTGVEQITEQWQARVAAEGFAKFNQVFKNLHPGYLKTTIPHFHDINHRLTAMEAAVQKDPLDRLKEARPLIDKINKYRWLNDHMNLLWEKGLPKRVCHNDTKVDNVLLDLTAMTYRHVIDLDTVMEGSWLYDFGDMMRTFLSPTKESEQEQSLIQVRMEIFHEILHACLKVLHREMMPLEKENLVFGGKYMCYLMAIRFLTDHLLGDVYYHISFEQENLVRAKNQLVMLKRMEESEQEMMRMVSDFKEGV